MLRCVFITYCVWGVLCFLWVEYLNVVVCVHYILCVGVGVLFIVHKCDGGGVCSSYILCVACYRVACFFVFHICEGGGVW